MGVKGLWSVSTKWGFARPIRANGAHSNKNLRLLHTYQSMQIIEKSLMLPGNKSEGALAVATHLRPEQNIYVVFLGS